MKHNRTKLLVFLMMLLLLLSVVTPMSAEEPYVEWTLSDDEQSLSDGTTTYTYYGKILKRDLTARQVYIYAEDVTLREEGILCPVCAAPTVSGIVWVRGEERCYLYATEEGAKILDRWFVDREIGSFRAWEDDYHSALLESAFVEALDAAVAQQAAMRTVQVSELAPLTRYELTAHDTASLFSKAYGVIYDWNGIYYYVNYSALGNQYFDADGNLSYREGTITLTLLDNELTTQFVTAVGTTEYIDVENDWEEQVTEIHVPPFVFWSFLVFLGFLLPIPLMVLGIWFANRQGWGRPKYWYSLTILGGIWLVLATLLTILLLCC